MKNLSQTQIKGFQIMVYRHKLSQNKNPNIQKFYQTLFSVHIAKENEQKAKAAELAYQNKQVNKAEVEATETVDTVASLPTETIREEQNDTGTTQQKIKFND